jgi:histidine ammonia-lyase
VDEDLLSPELGRLIDAAKAAAAAAAAAVPASRAEGWALLSADGCMYAGPDLGAVVSAVRMTASEPVAAAFAVAGETGEALLPPADQRAVLEDVDSGLLVAAKYLGRWVAVPLSELPPT